MQHPPAERVRRLAAAVERAEASTRAAIARDLGLEPHAFTEWLRVEAAAHGGDLAAALAAAEEELADDDARARAAADARARSKSQEAARRLYNAERGEQVGWAAFRNLLARAADRGLDGSTPAPPPPGQTIKGLSTLHVRDPETGEMRVSQVWTKTAAERDRRAQALEVMGRELARRIRPVAPAEAPRLVAARLLAHYTLTDCHIGALATPDEGGDVWKLKEAERVVVGCFDLMIRRSPPAETAVVAFLGDTADYDGLIPVTPSSGHVLDTDGRFEAVAATVARVQRAVIDAALRRHRRVVLLDAEGNHDPASSVQRRVFWRMLYAREPRLEVIQGGLPFYALQHGAVMLGWHHGHLVKAQQLPMILANEYPKIFGATTKRFIHVGHRHRNSEPAERDGFDMIEHPTLAGRNAYAARHGWRSMRRARAHFYDSRYGDVGSVSVSPEMLSPESAP